MTKELAKKPCAYVPDNAKINIGNDKMEDPKVKYEKRKAIFPREQIKEKVTKRDTP